MLIPQLSESANLATANQALCRDLSLLFTRLLTELERAIARSAGRPIAEEFEQRLNLYAAKHGWKVLTGLAHLTDLQEHVPEVDARMLANVLASYAQYARTLAGQILGEQLLLTTLVTFVNTLSPQAVELNRQYRIISV